MFRSLFAGAAAVWFANEAVSFLPVPFVWLNDGQLGGIDGDPGAVAVTWAARNLFVGLAIIALAIVDWGRLAAVIREPSSRTQRD